MIEILNTNYEVLKACLVALPPHAQKVFANQVATENVNQPQRVSDQEVAALVD